MKNNRCSALVVMGASMVTEVDRKSMRRSFVEKVELKGFLFLKNIFEEII